MSSAGGKQKVPDIDSGNSLYVMSLAAILKPETNAMLLTGLELRNG